MKESRRETWKWRGRREMEETKKGNKKWVQDRKNGQCPQTFLWIQFGRSRINDKLVLLQRIQSFQHRWVQRWHLGVVSLHSNLLISRPEQPSPMDNSLLGAATHQEGCCTPSWQYVLVGSPPLTNQESCTHTTRGSRDWTLQSYNSSPEAVPREKGQMESKT